MCACVREKDEVECGGEMHTCTLEFETNLDAIYTHETINNKKRICIRCFEQNRWSSFGRVTYRKESCYR